MGYLTTLAIVFIAIWCCFFLLLFHYGVFALIGVFKRTVYDAFSSPAMQNMGDMMMVNGGQDVEAAVFYDEGIYVGYKYYETRYFDKVLGQGNAGDYDYAATVQYPLSAPMRFCSFSPNRKCRKMAGKGVQPLHNYTCRFRPSSLIQADKSGLDGLQTGKLDSG